MNNYYLGYLDIGGSFNESNIEYISDNKEELLTILEDISWECFESIQGNGVLGYKEAEEQALELLFEEGVDDEGEDEGAILETIIKEILQEEKDSWIEVYEVEFDPESEKQKRDIERFRSGVYEQLINNTYND